MRTSPEFAANPIGVFFDPGLVYDAHHLVAPLPNFTWRSWRGSSVPIRWGKERAADCGNSRIFRYFLAQNRNLDYNPR
jgi:hypothetical protein